MRSFTHETGAPRTLALVVLVIFAALGLGRFGFSMLLPSMQIGLRLTNAQSGQLQSWNALGYLLAVVIAGILATRFGPSIVITVALAIVGIAMLANGWFTAFWAACAARFLAGAGGAAANVPAMGLLAAWFSSHRRGFASGCAVAGSSLGLAATGLAVPMMLAASPENGWRFCWATYGVITLTICLLCALFLRDHPDNTKTGNDNLGRGRIPWAALLRSRLLWQVSAAYFAFGFSYSIYATFFVRHLIYGQGLDSRLAGRIWMQIGMTSIISSFVWGSVSDHWGRRAALVAVFSCQGLAFLLAGTGDRMTITMASGTLFALTAWSIPAIVAALCGDAFGAHLAPTALGIATVVFGLGQVLGPLSGGLLADLTGSFRTAFGTAGCVALVLGAGGSSLLPRFLHTRGLNPNPAGSNA